MKEAIEFLKHCPPFYLATIDGAKPQVRPFWGLFASMKTSSIFLLKIKRMYIVR